MYCLYEWQIMVAQSLENVEESERSLLFREEEVNFQHGSLMLALQLAVYVANPPIAQAKVTFNTKVIIQIAKRYSCSFIYFVFSTHVTHSSKSRDFCVVGMRTTNEQNYAIQALLLVVQDHPLLYGESYFG
jgi:hypothetical protein